MNFSSVVTFAPPGSTITAGGGGLPAGTKVGGLISTEKLGIGSDSCHTVVNVNFVLYSVALPVAPVSGPHAGDVRWAANVAWPRQNGDGSRFNGWTVGAQSVTPLGGGTTPDATTPPNGNGLNALGNADAIQNYPSYLFDVFSATPGGTPIIPRAIYGGLTLVVGSTWVPLYFVQFDSSQLGALNALGGGLHISNSAEGFPSVSVLTDPSSPPAPSSITDFCTGSANGPNTLAVTTMLLGTSPAPGSFTRALSPAAGTRYITTYISSLRDTDQDGYENELDTCPLDPNVGDPRVQGTGDADGDGIDDSCDNLDNTPHNTITDSEPVPDGFKNRQDSCPQIANVSQAESEIQVVQADNGPEGDGMGDACDSSGTVSVPQNNNISGTHAPNLTITLSSTVSNGRFQLKTIVTPKCFGAVPAGGTDADADGYCLADDNGAVPAGSDADTARHNAWTQAQRQTLTGDTDGDGVSDGMETYLGTDPTHSCAQTGFQSAGVTKASDEGPMDNWAYDYNDDAKVDTSDVLAFAAVANNIPFGKETSAAAGTSGVPMVRFDINSDGLIGTPDILQFASVANGIPFNKVCGPGAGSSPQGGVIWALGSPMAPVVPPFKQQ